MVAHTPEPSRFDRAIADLIHRVEQVVYIVVAALIVGTLGLALVGATGLLWEGVHEPSAAETAIHVIDRLLLVLMLVEVLHTVHASIRTGTLVTQPFLIVALIASIRRVLVLTLETSQITQPEKWDISKQPLFNAAMIELGVMAGLIAVLITAIHLTRPHEEAKTEDEADEEEAKAG